MKRWLTALITAAVTVTLVACSGGSSEEGTTSETEESRPVTTEESQLLAIARFNNFDLGGRGFTAEVQERGVNLSLQGWVDYVGHFGYASVTGAFPSQSLVWAGSQVGIIEQEPDSAGNPPLPMPSLNDAGVTTAALDPSTSRLDTLLAIITTLGSDRPDNPLLLQQSGGLWLREDKVGDIPVTVFAAPPSDTPRDDSSPPLKADTSSLRLWVDAKGLIQRAEARIGTTWSTIDFSEPADPPLALTEGTPQ